MPDLAQFPLSGGGVLVVETDDATARRVMRGSHRCHRHCLLILFEVTLSKVRYAAEGILTSCVRWPSHPTKSKWNSA